MSLHNIICDCCGKTIAKHDFENIYIPCPECRKDGKEYSKAVNISLLAGSTGTYRA